MRVPYPTSGNWKQPQRSPFWRSHMPGQAQNEWIRSRVLAYIQPCEWAKQSFVGPQMVTALGGVFVVSGSILIVSLGGEGMVVLELVYQVGGCLMKTDDMAFPTIARPWGVQMTSCSVGGISCGEDDVSFRDVFLHPGQGGGWLIYSKEGGVVCKNQVDSGGGHRCTFGQRWRT